MGKAYSNKKKKEERPKNDLYVTPKSLVWVMKNTIEEFFPKTEPILEPCCGNKDISIPLQELGYVVDNNDITGGLNYLKNDWKQKYVITNPPFFLFDDFIQKMKNHCEIFMVIGRLNYLATNSRFQNKLWDKLSHIYIFNRYVDYQTPSRDDGLFHVGAMATGWFLFKKNFVGQTTLSVVDVQKYAKLGNFKKVK